MNRFKRLGWVLLLMLSSRIAIAQGTGANFFSVPECRIFDSRSTDVPILNGGDHRLVNPVGRCGIPSSAVAVSINVTVVLPSSDGYIALLPGDQTAPQTTANLNFPAGSVRGNHAIQMLAANGTGTFTVNPALSAGAAGTVNVVIDVDGFYTSDPAPPAPAEGPFQYFPISSCRSLDTRSTTTPLTPGEQRPIRIAGSCGIPNGAMAVQLNATIINPTATGYLTLYPASSTSPPPVASLNYTAPRIATGNGAVVRLDGFPEDMKARATSATADLALDAFGYFDRGANFPYHPLSGCRAVDTRLTGGAVPADTKRTVDVVTACGIPSSAQAVVANITVVSPSSDGYLRVAPDNSVLPLTSALNFAHTDTSIGNELIFGLRDEMGQAQPLAITPSMGGPGNQVHVIVDVFGYFEGPTTAAIVNAASGGVSSAEYRSTDRGFFPDQVYHIADMDNVNLFNGNLNINLPIGPRYPIGGGLSYGLTLSYNSNIRDIKTKTLQFGPGDFKDYAQTVPRQTSNAGVGWTLGMGQFRFNGEASHYEYTSPDGAAHLFYDTLNTYTGTTLSVANPSYKYTRDGSYLRLNISTSQAVVESPDGMTLTFDGAPSWKLSRIGNRFTNDYVNIATQLNGDQSVARWTISDVHGRSQVVQFVRDPSNWYKSGVVDHVDLSSFGGQLAATYQFVYVTSPMNRGCQDTIPPSDPDIPGVPLLSQIILPDQASTYSFQYYSTAGGGGACSGDLLQSVKYPTGGTATWTYQDATFSMSLCSRLSGGYDHEAAVASKTLSIPGQSPNPTWTYNRYKSTPPAIGFIPCSATTSHAPVPEELRVEVISPARGAVTGTGQRVTKIENYFSIWPRAEQAVPGSAFDPKEYSLPLTHRVDDGQGRFLSTEVFDCDAGDPTACYPTGSLFPVTNADPLRRTYVRYEKDSTGNANWYLGDVGINLQRRLASEHTVYLDDGGKFTTTERTDFDGLGHYRQVTTHSNFFGTFSDDPDETTVTAFNQGVQPGYNSGTYSANAPSGNTFAMYPTGAPWLVDLYSDRSVTRSSGFDARELYCFDPATGFLNAKRTLSSSSASGPPNLLSKDILVSYAPVADASGNILSESYYGADDLGLSTTDTCAIPGGQPTYKISHTYQYGALASSRYFDTLTGFQMPFNSLDLDIDWSTGLPKSSRDTAGVCTSFTYDKLNRLSWVKPGDPTGSSVGCTTAPSNAAWVSRTYRVASSGCSPANLNACADVRATAYFSGTTGGSILADTDTIFDGLGRVSSERQKLPDGSWNERLTTYNGAGSKAFVSEVALQGATTFGTTFKDYDPFGRPGTVVGPDGKKVDFTYQGSRVVNRIVDVATGAGGATTSSRTSEFYDHLGSLHRVNEPFDLDQNGSPSATTTYQYDARGNLLQVTMLNSSGSQSRGFTYDGLGFLRSERHPEKDPNTAVTGSNDVDYMNYDARGHFRRKVDGDVDTRYAYDKAERLLGVATPAGLPLKDFSYDTGAGCCFNGKLAKAKRYNDVTLSGANTRFQLIQDYTYGGRGGAVSQRKYTLMKDSVLQPEQFIQTFTFNDLGDIANQQYPQCNFSACSTTANPVRTQTYSFSQGRLFSTGTLAGAPAISATFGFYPNGAIQQVLFANESWNQSIAFNMPRTDRISILQGGVEHGALGPYSYDAAGNIYAIGPQTYTYDRLSRVTSGSLDSTHTQTYTYDGFGNITSIGGTTGRAVNVSSASNRLNGPGTFYDKAGNLTSWNGQTYAYDSFNQMKHFQAGTVDSWYVYDADDERVLTLNLSGGARNQDHWTLRGLGNEVLRTYDVTQGAMPPAGSYVYKDYFYRGSTLFASYSAAEGERHLHVNHLGTPTAMNDGTGAPLGTHFYYPYGEEGYTAPAAVASDTLRFTGHERDLNDPAGSGDDLDYMHTQHSGPLTGRFLSADLASGRPGTPQSWNKYSYAIDNPVNRLDANGREDGGTMSLDRKGGAWGNVDKAGNLVRFSGTPMAKNDPVPAMMFLVTAAIFAPPIAAEAGVSEGVVLFSMTSNAVAGAATNPGNAWNGAAVNVGVGGVTPMLGGLVGTPLSMIGSSQITAKLLGGTAPAIGPIAGYGIALGFIDSVAEHSGIPALKDAAAILSGAAVLELALADRLSGVPPPSACPSNNQGGTNGCPK